MMKLGFIGLGIMGKPMALRLINKGYDVYVFDIDAKKVSDVVNEGGIGARSAKEVAAHSEITFTIVPNSEHVEEVIFGENGIASGAKEGHIVVDMSSISPAVSKRLAEKLAKQNIHMLDAPVSGGEQGAIDGTLAIMVGGEYAIFERVKPLMACMGKEITYVGGHGAGTTTKLANQIIVNVNIAAMAEAFTLAAKAGIDVEKLYMAIRSGLAGSRVLDMKAPMILERNFQAGGRIDINLKDLNNVLNFAESIEMDTPLTARVAQMFRALADEGKATLDHCGLIQYYEKKENIVVKRRDGSE